MELFTDEDQKHILEQGVQSQFWLLISTKWQYFRKIALNNLLTQDTSDRSFLAGKVKGMDDLLGYPEKHIETLKKKLEINKE